MWLEKKPANKRFQDLTAAIHAIDEHAQRASTRVEDVCLTTRPWKPAGAPYSVHFLAPTDFDRARVRRLWNKVVQYAKGSFRLSTRFERVLNGEAELGDAPNAVSLAVAIEWGERKILLAGDVENGKRSAKSGWKGVLQILDHPDERLGHLVEDVDLVKVAHHGSKGAFSAEAWARHAKSRKTTAVLTPFAPSALPSDRTLVNLRGHCDRLGISADAGQAFARTTAAGWTPIQSTLPPSGAPVVAAVLDGEGDGLLLWGAQAGLFRS